MDYNWRYAIFVQADRQNTANNMAQAFDPDTGGALTFTRGCSASGGEPPTHYVCNTAADVSMRTGILNAFSQIPWAEIYVLDGYEESNGVNVRIPPWTYGDTLADMSLQIIEPDTGIE